ncbi:RHS repeat protein, partial [Amycolatopsis rhizosphaerae]
MTNPLVAQTKDSTTAFSGVTILEDAQGLVSSIESGDWASAVMGAAGTAMDALAFVTDPFGSILAAGVGWLMEHVGPLKDMLDKLAGNPDQITAHSETWKNISTELGQVSADLANQVNTDIQSWTGPGADAYRQQAGEMAKVLEAAGKACDGASSGVKTAGEVVAAVRQLVRDTIAQVVGHMVSWALQVLFTLGIGLTWVVPQVVNLVAKTAKQIADLIKKLTKALSELGKLLGKAGDLFKDASKGLKGLKPGSAAKPGKVDTLPSGARNVDPVAGRPTTSSGAGHNGSVDPGKVSAPPKLDGGAGGTTASSAGKPDGGSVALPPKLDEGAGGTKPSGTGKPDGGSVAPPPKLDEGAGGTTASGASAKGAGGNSSTASGGSTRGDAIGKDTRVCDSDPVDVMTGDVVANEVDLSLSGPVELLLERMHISSYRAGQWFGPSWSSTLDQRVQVDEDNIRYCSADGMILVYPQPAAGASVLPLEGPRLPLTPAGTGFRLDDPQREQSLFFAPVAGSRVGVLPLVALEQRDAYRVDIDHDRSGMPARLRHSDGRVVRVAGTSGRITGIEVVEAGTERAVKVAEFGYDDRGHLVQVVNSSGLAARYDYDDHGRMTGWQDRTGTWYRYVYDDRGRCVRTLGSDGFFSGTFTYDRERLITVYTNSLGATTEYHFTAERQLSRRVDQLGNVTAFTWDRYDRLLSRTDPLGLTTSFGYDEQGTLASVTRPDGSVLRVTPGPDGLTIEAEAEDGTVLSRFYPRGEAPDPFEEPLGVAAPLRTEKLTGEKGGEREDAGVPEDRDLFGRPRFALNRSRRRVGLGWTVEGQENLRVQPSGVQEIRRYDPEGNEVEHVNGAGFATRTEYGLFDLPVATIDASGARTTYAYDTELRLVAVTNPLGLKWTYRYDPAGRLVEETDFDGRTLRFT